MDTLEIYEACLKDEYIKPFFHGVYPINQLPKQLSPGGIYFANLDPDFLQGSHWVVLHSLSPDCSIYFDSFGRKPPASICKSLFSHSPKVYFSDIPLQHILSQSCGFFCLYVASLWARGYSMLDILLHHFYNPQEFQPFINDVLVQSVISSHLHMKPRPVLLPEVYKR